MLFNQSNNPDEGIRTGPYDIRRSKVHLAQLEGKAVIMANIQSHTDDNTISYIDIRSKVWLLVLNYAGMTTNADEARQINLCGSSKIIEIQ